MLRPAEGFCPYHPQEGIPGSINTRGSYTSASDPFMQQLTPARGIIIAGCILLSGTILLLYVAAPGTAPPASDRPAVYLVYASAGTMTQLLNTGQIDAFLVWEPVVSTTELAGIGKMIASPNDIPPPGKWTDAASCVLVLRKDVTYQYPEQSALLSALTTAAIIRIHEDPGPAEEITADWVFGKSPILTPGGSLSPPDVEHLSFRNMAFTADALPPQSGTVQHTLSELGTTVYSPEDMMDPAIATRGRQFLNGTAVPRTSGDLPTFNIGYLPSSDNFAPLYVMVRDSAYFCSRYGFCLVPDDPSSSRPVACTLTVKGTPAARVNLIPGQSGGGIMTTIGQKALAGAYVGSIPAEMQIALGNPSSIIQSINTGGSGLVVGTKNPCRDWTGFTRWVKDRSAAARPVVVATVQSSIQEDMLRDALAYENISVKFYGTDFKAGYP